MKIFLAGAESDEHIATLIAERAPRILMSFFHGPWKKRDLHPKLLAVLQSANERFIDSGAYTIRTSVSTIIGRKHNNAGSIDLDLYVARYIAWLKQVHRLNLVDWWVELDIGSLAGYAWVNQTRDKIVKAGLGCGLINVWHSEMDWDYWLFLLREASNPGRSRYVAIEGNQSTRPQLEYNRFLHEAYKRGVRVHGFKMTTSDDLKRFPFYSVDSTTWLSPVHGSAPATIRSGGVCSMNPGSSSAGALSGQRTVWRGFLPRSQTRSWRRGILRSSILVWLRQEKRLHEWWLMRGVDWDKAIAAPEVVECLLA